MLILVTGGAASGKSAHAERLLCKCAPSSRLYLATMQPFGAAAQARIARHRALREGKGFETVECPLGLQNLSFSQRYDGILLEDLGNLLANEIFAPDGAGDAAFGSILAAIAHLQDCCETLVVVTDEIFSDGVDYPPETAQYIRDLAALNRALAKQAGAVYESVCGILLPLKGEKNA